MTAPVLSVRGLRVALPAGGERAHAVDGVSFALEAGKVLCLVGESGSGKSMCAHALMGLLPRGVRACGGEMHFEGRDLLALGEEQWLAVRGRRIAMVFQEPMTALNPLMRVGDQMLEMFEAHGLFTARERRGRILAAAGEVGLPDPEAILRAFPHQLSGGQRQRAMIAMALSMEPAVLVADEPTTALDVTTQAQILELMRRLQEHRDMAVLFITHDFGVVAEIADSVVVMQEGRCVEAGPVEAVLQRPEHPYTRSLLAAVPSLEPPPPGQTGQGQRALEVRSLAKTYVSRNGWFQRERRVAAVKDVGFTVHQGETLGLVGESGSGKSSVARLALRLMDADAGSVLLGEGDLTRMTRKALRAERSRIQMIFQDPYASLNPRRKVGLIISDGPVAHGVERAAALAQARELLQTVGLEARAAERFPHEFSGGQRQRIAIARAIAMRPEILVADEPVSALDVSVQAQVLGLLQDLKVRFGLSMLFITHDLRVAAQVCDRIAVMHRGVVVELRTAAALFAQPQHPYTRELLAAVPGRRRGFATTGPGRAEAGDGGAAQAPSRAGGGG